MRRWQKKKQKKKNNVVDLSSFKSRFRFQEQVVFLLFFGFRSVLFCVFTILRFQFRFRSLFPRTNPCFILHLRGVSLTLRLSPSPFLLIFGVCFCGFFALFILALFVTAEWHFGLSLSFLLLFSVRRPAFIGVEKPETLIYARRLTRCLGVCVRILLYFGWLFLKSRLHLQQQQKIKQPHTCVCLRAMIQNINRIAVAAVTHSHSAQKKKNNTEI